MILAFSSTKRAFDTEVSKDDVWNVIEGELDQKRWKFIATALQALPSQTLKVRFVCDLAQARIRTTPYVAFFSVVIAAMMILKRVTLGKRAAS